MKINCNSIIVNLTKEERDEISNYITNVLYNRRNDTDGMYMLPYLDDNFKLIIDIVNCGFSDFYGSYKPKSNKDITINLVNDGIRGFRASLMRQEDREIARDLASCTILKDDINGNLSSLKELYESKEDYKYNNIVTFNPKLNYKTFDMDEYVRDFYEKNGYYTKQNAVNTKKRGRK